MHAEYIGKKILSDSGNVIGLKTLNQPYLIGLLAGYSLLRDVAGLARAARKAWVLTINEAKAKAIIPVAGNTHQGMEMRTG